MKFDTEVRNYISTIIGDIDVDVHIQFNPRSFLAEQEEKINVEMVNRNLSALAGELRYDIKKLLQDKLKDLDESESK